MDAERLADYLAGELDPDEQRAVEAELARDPALRTRLRRLQTADEALAGLPPSQPREGFEERLQDILGPQVRAHLEAEAVTASGTAASEAGPVAGAGGGEVPEDVAAEDELARRRERARRTPGGANWTRAVGGVAAAIALIAVAGLAITGLPGPGTGDDAADDIAMDAPTSEEAEAPEAARTDGPVVLSSDRDVDAADAGDLLDEPALERLSRRDLGTAEGASLARRYTDILGDDERLRRDTSAPDADDALEDAAPDDPRDEAAPETEATEDTDAESASGGQFTAAGAGLDEAERDDVRRCLETLIEGADAPIPAYVEVASYEGEPAIVFGMLARGTQDERYERLEVWVLDRADCQVRTLQQRDR